MTSCFPCHCQKYRLFLTCKLFPLESERNRENVQDSYAPTWATCKYVLKYLPHFNEEILGLSQKSLRNHNKVKRPNGGCRCIGCILWIRIFYTISYICFSHENKNMAYVTVILFFNFIYLHTWIPNYPQKQDYIGHNIFCFAKLSYSWYIFKKIYMLYE